MQSCFTIALRKTGSDKPGTCFIPGVPIPPTPENPNPPAPANICGPADMCQYADYKLWMRVADCAGINGTCGGGPWQPYDQNGRPSGKGLTNHPGPIPPADPQEAREAEVNVLIHNLECRSFDQVFLSAKSKDRVEHQFRVRWVCGKCDKDPIPHEIPN
jgi:hypothetical protein